MWSDKTSDSLYKVVRPVSTVLQGVGAGVLAAMMFLTASDVTLRQFKLPIMGTDDITAFLMAILISFGLAYCAIKKGHIQVELIVEHLPSRVQAVIDSITTLLGFGLCTLITWQSFANMVSVYHSGATSWTLNIIAFPFAGLVAFGFIWFTLVLLADFLNAISKVVKG
ncbi:MAG: TRAP transporter small permease [Dehalococcoidales bacterium]|nr:TRAP transporter small permease [Dehalococcoidales bacterium]